MNRTDYQRKYRNRPENKERLQEYKREWMRKWRADNPQKHFKQSRKDARNYRENNPEKVKARSKVFIEKRAGRLIPTPCEVCGKKKVEAHHDDYSKPLVVRWFCRKHHREIEDDLSTS